MKSQMPLMNSQTLGGEAMLLIQEAIQTSEPVAKSLTTTGWIFMSLAWTLILATVIFCYSKVLRKSAAQRAPGRQAMGKTDREVANESVPQ